MISPAYSMQGKVRKGKEREMYEIDGGGEIETGWKCNGCAYKFFSGMTLHVSGKPHCPSCKLEIISFERTDESGLWNYIAKTEKDKFSSVSTQVEGK